MKIAKVLAAVLVVVGACTTLTVRRNFTVLHLESEQIAAAGVGPIRLVLDKDLRLHGFGGRRDMSRLFDGQTVHCRADYGTLCKAHSLLAAAALARTALPNGESALTAEVPARCLLVFNEGPDDVVLLGNLVDGHGADGSLQINLSTMTIYADNGQTLYSEGAGWDDERVLAYFSSGGKCSGG